MNNFFEWFNKKSLKYKIRGWIIVTTGIMQIIHWLIITFSTRKIYFLIGVIFIALTTLSSIKDKFEKIRTDPVVTQLLYLAISWRYLYYVISFKTSIVLILFEIALMLVGLLKIYTYKTRKK